MLPDEDSINSVLRPYIQPWYDSVENPSKAQEQVLAQVMRCAPGANAMTKQIMLAVGGEPLGQVLDRAATLFSAALRGPEAAEGTQAFLEKRLPQWAAAGNVETGDADVR